MTRHIELADSNRPEAAVAEPVFRKAMKRIDKLARALAQSYAPVQSNGAFAIEAGREAARQALIIEMIEWFNSELDGDVIVITHEDTHS